MGEYTKKEYLYFEGFYFLETNQIFIRKIKKEFALLQLDN
jgi:hypothetical protein